MATRFFEVKEISKRFGGLMAVGGVSFQVERGEIFKISKRIKQEGVTILVTEQNTKQSLKISDRVYVLENGRVVLSGSGQELLNNEHVKQAYLGI